MLRSSMDRLPQADARSQSSHASRKTLCIAALALASLAGAADTAGAGDANGGAGSDLLRAGLAQAGQSLVFTIRTAAPVPLADLDPFPPVAGVTHGGYLCVSFRRPGALGERRLCLGGGRPPPADRPQCDRRLGRDDRQGHAGRAREAAEREQAGRIAAAVGGRPYAAALPLAGAEPGTVASRPGPPAPSTASPPRATGSSACAPSARSAARAAPRGWDTNGPRGRKIVALTFDDGPSTYTPGFLRVLRDKHVHGTFFEVGQEMAGREATMRKILAEGNEIGNHTMHHGFYPGYADLAATSARIEAITHFRPCLFRPPGGGVDSAVVAAAGQAGMRTITWDVDPTDWATPGTGAIYSRIVGAARPGSIILMHDGGGNRGEHAGGAALDHRHAAGRVATTSRR